MSILVLFLSTSVTNTPFIALPFPLSMSDVLMFPLLTHISIALIEMGGESWVGRRGIFKKLFHAIMEADKSQDHSQQAGDPGEPTV